MVTSAINVIKDNLFFGLKRSVFSTEKRFADTLSTIESIKRRCKDVDYRIIVIDSTILEHKYIKELTDKVDLLIQYTDDKVVTDINSECKSLGETSLINRFLQDLQDIEFKILIKLSGRYSLTDQFDINNFSDKSITIKTQDGFGACTGDKAVITIVYGVPLSKLDVFTKQTTKCYDLLNKRMELDIEKILIKGMEEHCMSIETLGVTGEAASWGYSNTF